MPFKSRFIPTLGMNLSPELECITVLEENVSDIFNTTTAEVAL